MTDPRPSGGPPALETTRVNGGISARLVALITVGVLVGVVWVGMSGRESVPPPVADVPPSAAARSLSTPTPAPSATPRSFEPPRFLQVSRPLGDDAFGMIGFVDGRNYLDLLQEVEPGHLSGEFVLPYSAGMADGTLQLAQLWTREERRSYVSLGEWELDLDALRPGGRQSLTLVDLTAPARPQMRDATRLTSTGYRLLVRAESQAEYAVVTADVYLGLTHGPARAERYVVTGAVGNEPFEIVLSQDETGALSGQYWLEDPPGPAELTFELSSSRGTARTADRAYVGAWTVGLDELASGHRSGAGPFSVSVPSRLKMLVAPTAIRTGYVLDVGVRLAFDEVAVVDFEMRLGSVRRVGGDDGVLGGLTSSR